MWTNDVKHYGNGVLRNREGYAINPRTTTSYVFNPNTTTLESRLVNIENSIKQSDWNESDGNSMAFIRNKPSIPSIPNNLQKHYYKNTITGLSGDELKALIVGDVCIYNSTEYEVIYKDSTKVVLCADDQSDLIFVTYTSYSYTGTKRVSIITPVATSLPSDNRMLPNVLYNLGTLSSTTTFELAAATNNTIVNVWMWTFSTGSTPPTINWPAAITMWSTGTMPVIGANKYYEINVMNGLAKVTIADLP